MDENTIATISGKMLVPGVSRNGRLYTKDLISKAVTRLQARLSDPNGLPVNMRTHHDAGDDSLRIVGRLNTVRLNEATGAAEYSADLYDTTAGRDIAGITTGKKPALRTVSIHGYFLGPTKRVQHDGDTVTTADDLEIDFVDFTGSPGVTGALIDVAPAATRESVDGRTPISESYDATIQRVVDAAPEPSVIEATFTAKQRKATAAKGQAMKDGSYPIRNKSDLRNAIRAVGRGNANHDSIRAHIIARAKALGLTQMIPDTWNSDGSMKENVTRFGEVREYAQGPDNQAGFSIDAWNGPIYVTMRSCDIDPAGLRAVTAAAVKAAVDALQAMDPDMDADIDVAGDRGDDTDGDMTTVKKAGESLEPRNGVIPIEEMRAIADEAPIPTTESTPALGERNESEDPAVSEATTKAAETSAATRTLTDDDIRALGVLFRDAVTEAVKAVAAPVAETAKPAAETAKAPEPATAVETVVPDAAEKAARKAGKRAAKLEESINARIAEAVATQRAAIAESVRVEVTESVTAKVRDELTSLASRKGFTVHENDSAAGAAAAQPTDEELFADRANLLLGDWAKTPAPGAASASLIDRFRVTQPSA